MCQKCTLESVSQSKRLCKGRGAAPTRELERARNAKILKKHFNFSLSQSGSLAGWTNDWSPEPTMGTSAGLELELLPTRPLASIRRVIPASLVLLKIQSFTQSCLNLFLCTKEACRVVVPATSDSIRKEFVTTGRHTTFSCILHNATQAPRRIRSIITNSSLEHWNSRMDGTDCSHWPEPM